MAKITLDKIAEALAPESWKVISNEYKNLSTEMTFECPRGHQVYSSWQKIRSRRDCPVCKQSALSANEERLLTKPKGVTRILALDQATKVTGYSIFDNGTLVKVGTFVTKDEDEIARCVAVKNWLLSMIQNLKPDHIGIEGIQYQAKVSDGSSVGSVTVFQTLAHLQGILLATCYENGVPYTVCPTNTWRCACGVKGRTRTDKKKSMQLLARQWYNIKATDDEADAIGIGYYLSTTITKKMEISNWET